MQNYQFIGWFLVNVGVPLFAPIALLPLLSAGRQHRGQAGMLLKGAIQDGQLYWPVIAMCAVACYEAAGVIHPPNLAQNANNVALAWSAIAWHVLVIVISSVLVTISTSDATVTSKARKTENLSPVVLISIAASAATAITFPATHLLAR